AAPTGPRICRWAIARSPPTKKAFSLPDPLQFVLGRLIHAVKSLPQSAGCYRQILKSPRPRYLRNLFIGFAITSVNVGGGIVPSNPTAALHQNFVRDQNYRTAIRSIENLRHASGARVQSALNRTVRIYIHFQVLCAVVHPSDQ